MLKRYVLSILALTIALAGCQPRQGVGAGQGSDGQSRGSSGAGETGTVDGGGGGNGINHIPLEGYHVNMLTQDEVKADVLPKILELAKANLEFAGEMYHILAQRSWKFVPVSMQKLSSARIGVYFPTDQFALQDTKEVWVDKTNFTEMTTDNRAELIIHELVMGIAIMQFTDDNDHCKVKADEITLIPKDPRDVKGPDNIRSACDSQYRPHLIGTLEVGTKLSNDDYARIRTLTEKIAEHDGPFDAQEVHDWLVSTGFAN